MKFALLFYEMPCRVCTPAKLSAVSSVNTKSRRLLTKASRPKSGGSPAGILTIAFVSETVRSS